MIKFYFSLAPNPMKVALLLEELGEPYEPIPVDTRKGQQHAPQFLAVNPNAKVPAIVDGDATVFDSNAILLYLAEKTRRFLPDGGLAGRGALLSWMMFVASGIGPYSGQAVHFRQYCPEPNPYALKRYDFEAGRHWAIVDERLSRGRYMLAETYTIVDMSVWGWARLIPTVMGGEAAWARFPNVRRLLDEINQRPAAAAVERLRGKFSFKTEFDDEARRHMFRHMDRSA